MPFPVPSPSFMTGQNVKTYFTYLLRNCFISFLSWDKNIKEWNSTTTKVLKPASKICFILYPIPNLGKWEKIKLTISNRQKALAKWYIIDWVASFKIFLNNSNWQQWKLNLRVWAEVWLSLVLLSRYYFHCFVLNELKWNLLDAYLFDISVTMILTQWPLDYDCCSKHAQQNAKGLLPLQWIWGTKRRKELQISKLI